MVASRARSLSQTFWGVHQARDGGAANTTVMQGALARLENELANLRAENERCAVVLSVLSAPPCSCVCTYGEQL